ncbi:MAG: hypothetical protein VYA34_00990 [Myxococcota bacterium]|nr:hypothetical protein [Myxococcota bacterium]
MLGALFFRTISQTFVSTILTLLLVGIGCDPSVSEPIDENQCGNGIIEAAEICDGNCPTICNDNNICTSDVLSGSASECSVRCTHTAITACVFGDDCCAPGCTNSNDSDCAPANENDCETGAQEQQSCGLNENGSQIRTCTDGAWGAFGDCADPDVCTTGATAQQACGLNENGSQIRTCTDGAWGAFGDCADPDVCTTGATAQQACGDNNNGNQSRVCVNGQWSDWTACNTVLGCTNPRALNYNLDATGDDGSCETVSSSPYFLEYAKPLYIPGQFPVSSCKDISKHHLCVSTKGCSWMRTIKNKGVCRADPVHRCLASGECKCEAHNFHGESAYDNDLEIFLPLSVTWSNLAPRTSTRGLNPTSQFTASIAMSEIQNESLGNFTSRTDFTNKTLSVTAKTSLDIDRISQSQGLTFAFKFMHVWDMDPPTMSGTLFEGLGIRAQLNNDALSLVVGDVTHSIGGETAFSATVKNYQCNQFTLVLSDNEDATVYLGSIATTIPGLRMSTVANHVASSATPLEVMQVGAANAKIWDVRLYGNNRKLTPSEIDEIGKRCSNAGDYAIADGYPKSNRRYSWGMGGYAIVPNHATQSFSSGVYVTMWIPEGDTFPPTDPSFLDNLRRMVGFWDRWHEQMFFEMDFIPYVDTRALAPENSKNTYRNYTPESNLCADPATCGEPRNYNNPCKYVTDLFQGFNWLPEDFPNEPTSADHRKIAESGGWTRWDSYDVDLYSGWQRPVHEHGHAAHFTIMRTYNKLNHYIRGISGESFAEIMAYYLFAGAKSWMNSGLTYFPMVPLAMEGRWDSLNEMHVLKYPQPYHGRNIGDLALGARFYGLNVWWTFVSHYAAKPYLIGRLAADTDETPGSTLQKMRFYLAQENQDLGDLFGNYAAHIVTWDWPKLGHHYYDREQQPFDNIEKWCTTNSGPNCTPDSLKVQLDLDASTGTNGVWEDSPALTNPGSFAYNAIRIASVPGGSRYEIGLEFEVAPYLYPDTSYAIGFNQMCKEDARFFSSRIVVVDSGTEGEEVRANRPQYYKIPGRKVENVMIETPEGRESTIYLLPVPTPPVEIDDVTPFVNGYSPVWPYKYKVTPLDSIPEDSQITPPILLNGQEMLPLDPQIGNGFTYDCFYDPEVEVRQNKFDACLNYCIDSGFQNSETDVSCNQQLSCRNACYLKFDGSTTSECENHCDRTATSGCFLTVNGRDYNMCGACVGEFSNGLVAECTLGCDFVN